MNSNGSALTQDEVMKQVGSPAKSGKKRTLRILAVVGVVLAVALVVAWRLKPSGAQAYKFLTTAVKKGDLDATVTATGTLAGKGTVTVGAETSGRVKAVHADFNDEVKAGQVLAEIDPSTIEAALKQAEAQLLSSQANLKNAEATATEQRLNAERTRTLAADGLASKQTLEAANAAADRAEAAVDQAKAQVVVSRASVDSNKTSLSKTQVRSPIDGVVLSRDVEVGQALVAAMSTPEIFTIARDLKDMEVTINIDEADVGRTRVGQHATFTVDAWPNQRFKGELRSIHNVAVTKDNVVTYEAVLSVDNGELLLRPGMTATVTIAVDRREGVLTVPNAALRFTPPSTNKKSAFDGPPGASIAPKDDRHRVWVLRDGEPKEVIVETGLTDGIQTEVRGELHDGDAVITDAEQRGAP